MKTYVTFKQTHAHSINGKTFDKDCVAVINCQSAGEGRRLAFQYFGAKFGDSYPVSNEYPESTWKSDHVYEFYPRGRIEVNP